MTLLMDRESMIWGACEDTGIDQQPCGDLATGRNGDTTCGGLLTDGQREQALRGRGGLRGHGHGDQQPRGGPARGRQRQGDGLRNSRDLHLITINTGIRITYVYIFVTYI